MMDHLKAKTGTDASNRLLKACVSQEMHQDGDFHLHVCAWYTHRLSFTDSRYMDLEGYHPNIKDSGIKRKKAALNYVSKEDPEPLQYNMDIKAETQARESHHKILGKRILDGTPLDELVTEDPSLIFGYKKLKADIEEYQRDRADNKPDLPDHIPNTWDLMLPVMPEEKRRHYWFYSTRPDCGKSTFLKSLVSNYRAKFMNKSENFQEFPRST